jgi:hypothetical protein
MLFLVLNRKLFIFFKALMRCITLLHLPKARKISLIACFNSVSDFRTCEISKQYSLYIYLYNLRLSFSQFLLSVFFCFICFTFLLVFFCNILHLFNFSFSKYNSFISLFHDLKNKSTFCNSTFIITRIFFS